MTEKEFLFLIDKIKKLLLNLYDKINYYKIYLFVGYFFILSLSTPILLFAPSHSQYLSFLKLKPFLNKTNYILPDMINYVLNPYYTKQLRESNKLIKYIKENYTIINKMPSLFQDTIILYCYKEKVPIEIVYNLISIESNWKPYMIGRKNKNGTKDYGLMQLNSRYIKEFIKWYYTGKEPFNPFNPYHNIEVGIKHLRAMYEYTHDWRLAVSAYNCGLYNVYKNKIPKSTKWYVKYIFKNVDLSS